MKCCFLGDTSIFDNLTEKNEQFRQLFISRIGQLSGEYYTLPSLDFLHFIPVILNFMFSFHSTKE